MIHSTSLIDIQLLMYPLSKENNEEDQTVSVVMETLYFGISDKNLISKFFMALFGYINVFSTL